MQENLNSKSLEQLRREQNAIAQKYQRKDFEVVPVDLEYAEKLKSQEVLRVEDVLSNVRRLTNRPQKKIIQSMNYEDARLIVWQVCKSKIQHQNKDFVVDRNNKQIITNLIQYFIGSPKCSLDLHKGLFLYGDVGLGKTFLMSIMQTFCEAAHLGQRKFEVVSCVDIAERYQVKGPEALEKYLSGTKDFCFDDLGQEPVEVKRYGNQSSVMERILVKRYNRFVNGSCITHITSNLLPDDVLNDYGSRLRDRFTEMFNFVYMPGESRRN